MLITLARLGLAHTLHHAATRLAPELYRQPPHAWALDRLAQSQQLACFVQKKKPKLDPRRRLFWVLYREFFPGLWKQHLHIVKPETVVRWHGDWVRIVWRIISRAPKRHGGRRCLSQEIRDLIKRMATENKWGATRIHGELLKLGFDVSERSVSNYLNKHFPYPEDRLKQWRAFLRNEAVAAMDYIVVPTASLGVYLYALVIIGHGRREVIHVNVTEHPTAAWVRQQLREAFPGDEPLPKYLIHDRDTSFCSREVHATIQAMGIKPCKTAYRCPWQTGIIERFNGTLRRELLAHVIIFGERHLLRLLREYIVYYNNHRTHLTRNKDSPLGRPVLARPSSDAAIVAIPHIGGLHHHYKWCPDSGAGEDRFQAAA